MNANHPAPLIRRAPVLLAALAASLAALLVTGCGADRPAPPPPDAGPSVSGTTVRFPGRVEGLRIEPVQDAGTTLITLPGRLAWDEDRTVRVVSPFGGRLMRALAQVGDPVRAGQPLAELASAEWGQAAADARRPI